MGVELEQLRDLMRPAGGLFRVLPLMRQELVGVMQRAAAGAIPDSVMAPALLASYRQIEAPQDGPPCTCIGCDRPLAGQPRSYAVAVSDPPIPGCALAMPVCAACGPDPAAIIAAVQPFLRHLWPQARALPACVFGEGGRA